MTNKIEVCKTCNGTGIEYDGAGHTCTACSGIAAPVANRTAKEVLEGRTQQDWEIIGLKATVAQQAQRNVEFVRLAQRMIEAEKILHLWTSNEIAIEAEFEYQEAFDALKIAIKLTESVSDVCTSCDGSGEYIDAIGDWRGYCSCPAGVALKNKPTGSHSPAPEPVHVCQKCYGLGSVPTRQAGEGETEYRNRCKLYTCIGKGGEYDRLGYAKPSGALRTIQGESGVIVYRDTKTGRLYFRDPADFQQRMQAIDNVKELNK